LLWWNYGKFCANILPCAVYTRIQAAIDTTYGSSTAINVAAVCEQFTVDGKGGFSSNEIDDLFGSLDDCYLLAVGSVMKPDASVRRAEGALKLLSATFAAYRRISV
jgi:hypothetical protein